MRQYQKILPSQFKLKDSNEAITGDFHIFWEERPTTAPGGYNSALCNIPQFYNENTYKFLIELRMAGNSSTTISKEFELRITNRGV